MSEPLNVLQADQEGYNRAVHECLVVLARWFYQSNPNARGARAEMQKLLKP